MKTARSLLHTIQSARVLVFAFACLVFLPQVAVSETKIAVRKKYIPKSYSWETVRRVAILPIVTKEKEAVAPGENRKWTATRMFPPDSVIQPFTHEMVRQIKHLDSSIVVMLIDSLKIQVPPSLVMKIAGGATDANAIMEMTITDIEYFEAKSEAPGPIINGAQLPAIPGRPAATKIRMSFAMTEPQSSRLIWQVDLEGKESNEGMGGSPDEADPPSPEALIEELVKTAGALLPFQ